MVINDVQGNKLRVKDAKFVDPYKKLFQQQKERVVKVGMTE